jgi:hypothetical protein
VELGFQADFLAGRRFDTTPGRRGIALQWADSSFGAKSIYSLERRAEFCSGRRERRPRRYKSCSAVHVFSEDRIMYRCIDDKHASVDCRRLSLNVHVYP